MLEEAPVEDAVLLVMVERLGRSDMAAWPAASVARRIEEKSIVGTRGDFNDGRILEVCRAKWLRDCCC